MSIIKYFKNIDSSIIKIMKNGYKFSFLLAIFSSYILFLYTYNPISHVWFESGILLLKTSITAFVAFLSLGFVFDKIKKGW
jgi:hypothetical protein